METQSCSAGYKEIWSKQDLFPSRSFLKALHEDLEYFVVEKIASSIIPVGSLAGNLTAQAAEQLGLTENTAVVVSYSGCERCSFLKF
ncbi:hypothetical protein [Paenibacillus sp. Marseille-Q9583]